MQDFEDLTIEEHLAGSIEVLRLVQASDAIRSQIRMAAEDCIRALGSGGKVMLAGNGGSAADAQHIAAELVGRFSLDRPGLAAVALTTDTSTLTAIANDFGYETVFSRQIEALGRVGDVLVAYSTSGSSANIVSALHTAREMGIRTIGMTGNRDGAMVSLCDRLIAIPSADTASIQEAHLVAGHLICRLVERAMFDLANRR